MTWIISLLLNNPIARAIGAALGALAAILAYGAMKKREGRQGARREAVEADHENAEDIRRRVRDNLDERVRKYDDSGWRED